MAGDTPNAGSGNRVRVMPMMDDDSGCIAGVVLAAGTSSRMGRNKLLLPIGGLSVLRRAVSIVVDGGLDPILG